MKKILITFLISFIILSCRNENNFENDSELCLILAEMFKNDQSIRNSPEIADPFLEILDSIKTANNLTGENYTKLNKEEQLKWGKIAKKIAEKRPKISKNIKDSLWNIQRDIDRKNTELLIEITKKRGWVDKNELGCKEYFAPVIIFRHAPEEFWDEIKPLIEKEYAEKRMSKGDYWFIDNHLRGRPNDYQIEDVTKIEK